MHTPSINKSTPAAGTSSASWVLITGASSGFGEEFARQYAEQGHALVLVARRLDRLQALADTLRQQHGTQVVVEQVDLSDLAAVARLHEQLSAQKYRDRRFDQQCRPWPARLVCRCSPR